MWRVTPPNYTVDAVLQLCTCNINRQDLKQRLAGTQNALVAASAEFVTALQTNTVHLFPAVQSVEAASKDELVWLYNSKLAAPNSPARDIYDHIKMATPNGRCPLCGRGVVYGLDHYLSKTHYANLTIAPMNLIPACQDCNKNKGEASPETAIEATIHPYMDDVDRQIWLRARVIEVSPPALYFFADPPMIWNLDLRDRIRSHFRLYKLRSLYAIEGATLISNLRCFLADNMAKGGSQAIREHLVAMAASSRRSNQNSWQAAAYTAMAESDWFCNGGYLLEG
jgi:hypothetical protein